MRVALLHLELSGGPEERNLAVLRSSISQAADAGAKWIVTPETALQGYFFTQKDRPFQITVQPSPEMEPIRQLALQFGLTIFLGCAERDAVTDLCYNSCLVIGENGKVIGRHRKVRSHGTGTEAYAALGEQVEPIDCGAMRAGVLVCADAYFEEYAVQLKEKKARVVVVPAAWPPGHCGGPPEVAWERCSRVSGLPVWVCNQTGNTEKMDMSQAQSAVVVNGKVQLAHSGLAPAVVLFDWDTESQQLVSRKFTVLPVEKWS